MRTNNFKRLGIFFLILFTCLGISCCRTAKNEVVKEKIAQEKKEIKQETIDSEIINDEKFSEQKSIVDEWKFFWETYGISYNGTSAEDEFEVIKTETGYKFKGKGTFNSSTENKNTTETNTTETDKLLQEQKKENSDYYISDELFEESSTKTKEHTDQSTGFNWNFTVVLAIVVVVALFLLYRYIKTKAGGI